MTWTDSFNIWFSLLTVLLLILLSIYGWRQRSIPGALPFAVGSLFAALWVASVIMETTAGDIPAKSFWVKVHVVWQMPAITAITCFILEYAWPGRWLTRRNLILLSVVPLLSLGLVMTNDLHHWVWRSMELVDTLTASYGFAGWFFFVYGYALLIVNIIIFAWLFLRSPQHRLPVGIMLMGQLGSRVVVFVDVTSRLRQMPYLDVFAIAIVFLSYAVALFVFRIFDPIPLARQAAIEQLHAGMLVLDPRGRIVSLNPAAEGILGISASQAKGMDIKNLLPDYPDRSTPLPEAAEIEFSLGTVPRVRHYTMTTSLLKDWRQLVVGYLVMLRDVTEHKRTQARIIEQQRAVAILNERERLARDLHDNLGQIFAFIHTQGQAVQRLLSRGAISEVDEYVSRMVEAAREADVDIRESILGLRMTLSGQGLLADLPRVLEQFEKMNTICTDLEVHGSFPEGTFEPQVEVHLLRILQEALTNVRKHAGARRVRIGFYLEDDMARITVRDDGQGFDLATLPDRSGEHVGVRVMRERAEEIGGSLRLYAAPGQGTVVEVIVPVGGGR